MFYLFALLPLLRTQISPNQLGGILEANGKVLISHDVHMPIASLPVMFSSLLITLQYWNGAHVTGCCEDRMVDGFEHFSSSSDELSSQ